MHEHATQHAPPTPVACHHCSAPARFVDGRTVYRGRRVDQNQRQFWHCAPCKAWARCADGTSTPLGLVANSELRRARHNAQAAFDGLWRGPDASLPHKDAVQWLMQVMDTHDARIEWFDLAQCRRVVDACIGFYLGVE